MSTLDRVLTFSCAPFKHLRHLDLENLALRQQVAKLRQSVKRPRAKLTDKSFWMFCSTHVGYWRALLPSPGFSAVLALEKAVHDEFVICQ